VWLESFAEVTVLISACMLRSVTAEREITVQVRCTEPVSASGRLRSMSDGAEP